MIKAKYLAKEYMEEQKILEQNEIQAKQPEEPKQNEIVNEFEKLNNVGIKSTNYSLFLGICIKIIIFLCICFII